MTTWPITGRPITTRYGIKGSHWRACGFHTGADIAAPTGTPILAPEAGRIVHVNYGASFGGKQLVLRPASGGEWFFAHCSWRIGPGQVAEGQHIANVGTEGNSTGPHLHLEWHVAPGWSCALMRDPAVRLAAPGPAPAPEPTPPEEEEDMRHWAVQLGADRGVYITDFATFRTGINDPLVLSEGLHYGVLRWYADGRPVQTQVVQHILKLPLVA